MKKHWQTFVSGYAAMNKQMRFILAMLCMLPGFSLGAIVWYLVVDTQAKQATFSLLTAAHKGAKIDNGTLGSIGIEMLSTFHPVLAIIITSLVLAIVGAVVLGMTMLADASIKKNAKKADAIQGNAAQA